MRFPNAYKGISKMFVAEILKLIAAGLIVAGSIATIFSGVGSVIGAAIENADVTEQQLDQMITAPGALIAGIVMGGIAMLLFIIAYILNLVGLGQASRDEDNLRNAFIVSIVVLIVSIISAIITSTNVASGTGGDIAQVVRTVAEIFVMISVIIGVQNLARALGDRGEQVLGNRLLTVITISLIVSAVATFISIFFNNSVMQTVDGILGIIAGVAMIVAYIMYIIFLGKARRILREGR